MNWLNNLKIMPLLVLVAALSFGVRFGDFVTGVSDISGSANAQTTDQTAAAGGEPKEAMEAATTDKLSLPPPPTMTPETTKTVADLEEDAPDWRDAGDADFEFSEVRMELFKDLTKRRKALEVRERELSVREALLKAAEQEITQKYDELVSLRSEIQDLLKEQTEEEKKRTTSLVKIYEGMKPKDAARIFNTLDMDVLLNVVSRMSERKSAPILASMDPARARSLTIMLMEQKSLPNVEQDINS
jgi:flagellar motility protein MotE (MotC chaperone)